MMECNREQYKYNTENTGQVIIVGRVVEQQQVLSDIDVTRGRPEPKRSPAEAIRTGPHRQP